MTPKQIRDLRKRLRNADGKPMTGDQFAAALGLTGRHRGLQVYKWESTKHNKKPGPQTILLMQMLNNAHLER